MNALGLAVGPMSVLPLYSNLSVVEQQKIFSPAPFSRVKGMYGRLDSPHIHVLQYLFRSEVRRLHEYR